MIEQISETEFKLTKGNHRMTLIRNKSSEWEMMTSNPSTRAWNGRMPSFRRFNSLVEVEMAYRSWRGIAALVTQGVEAARDIKAHLESFGIRVVDGGA